MSWLRPRARPFPPAPRARRRLSCLRARGHSSRTMRGAANVPMDPSVDALTVTSLTDETSQGVYCRRMRISALQCRQAWLGLCDFIFAQLKNQRGVSLPGLGSFAVGACVDTANGGVVAPRAPVFALSSPKFDGVPQARGRFFLVKPAIRAREHDRHRGALRRAQGGRRARAQGDARRDRGQNDQGRARGCRFLLRTVRRAPRRRDARGDALLPRLPRTRDGFVRGGPEERPGARRPRTHVPAQPQRRREGETGRHAREGHRHDARAGDGGGGDARAAEDAADAFAVESRLAPTGAFKLSKKPQSARRVPGSAAAATPAGSAFLAMCARIDRLRVGHVERLRLERVLNDEDLCAGLVADVPVSVVRDTIRAASCGREGKFVAYLPVCRALEAAAVAARAARAAAAEDAAARAAARGAAGGGARRRRHVRDRGCRGGGEAAGGGGDRERAPRARGPRGAHRGAVSLL